MDVDQVLSIREVAALEASYVASGHDALVVPGNHEDAIVSGIGIDSGTYRKNKQETNINELIEDLRRPEFESARSYVMEKLAVKNGLRFSVDGDGKLAALVIHGALSGKEEKYLHDVPARLPDPRARSPRPLASPGIKRASARQLHFDGRARGADHAAGP